MNLVIVESPAKAKTINKYLGSDYEVLASYGHVRDLPSKDGSVLPDDDFSMHWEADAKGAKRLSEIAEAAKRADRVILATDPDREGEAISWHVLEVLNKKKALKDTHVERVTFNAITKSAVLEAMANPRQLDMELVEAYLARRALGLSGGLHPVAGPVAQAAGRPFGRAGAIGRPSHRRRSRNGDREVQASGILVDRGRPERRQPALHRAPGQARRQAGPASGHQGRGDRQTPRAPRSRPATSPSIRSRRSRFGAIPRPPSPPRPCSRKPRASWASPPSAPCRRRRNCMKASTRPAA